jgi:hypothetical protein
VVEWRTYVNVPNVDQNVEQVRAVAAELDAELIVVADGYYLHSSEVDTVTSPEGRPEDEAVKAVGQLITEINRLGRLRYGYLHRDVGFREMARIEDGVLRSSTVFSNVVGPVSATTLEPLPLPGAHERASRDPAFAEALELYIGARTLPELYKAYEVLRRIAGSQSAVDEWAGGQKKRGRFTQSAQQDRHAPPSGNDPFVPMTVREGDQFIRLLLKRALEGDPSGQDVGRTSDRP